MITLVGSDEDLTVQDCLEWIGMSRKSWDLRMMRRNCRIGQLWFNSLTPSDMAKLSGSYHDPYHADNWPAVIRALRFLLEN